MDNLQANILGGNEILSSKRFVINIKNMCAFIKSCEVTIPVNTKQCKYFLTRKLLASKEKRIPLHLDLMIPLVLVLLSDNCNFLFYPTTQANLILYTHIIDHKTSKILVRNTSNRLLHILYCQKLDHIINIAYNNCFLADT